MSPKAKAETKAGGSSKGWTKPTSRAEQDEAVRVLAAMKPYCERGKVDISLVCEMLLGIFKGTRTADALIRKLVGVGKEALPKMCDKPGLIAPGELTAWYFETAWPAVLDARASTEVHRKKSEQLHAAEKEQHAREVARLKLDQAARDAQQVTGGEGAEGGGDDEPEGGHEAAAVPLAAATDEPIGWQVARVVEVDESRRLVVLFADASRGRARRMSFGPAPVSAPPDVNAPGGGLPPEMSIASDKVPAVLRDALQPVQDAELLTHAPSSPGGVVPVGKLLHFWFQAVWPKHGPKLREGRKIEFRGALSTNVEWGDAVDPDDEVER